MKKRIIFILLLVPVLLLSCGLFQGSQIIENKSFPLDERWSFVLSAPVYKLAVTDEAIAVGTADGVNTIEAETGRLLWSLNLPLDTDSLLAFTEEGLVAVDSIKKQIVMIGMEGDEIKRFDLDSAESFQVLAVYSNFIFVRRIPSWNLEVYDLRKGIKTWQVLVDRGDVSISLDPTTEIAYITTSSFVSAHDTISGNTIWKFYKETRTGTLESGILYYFAEDSENNNNTNVGYISAVDVQSANQLWAMEVPLKIRTAIYNLTIFNDLLIASTDFGLLAINKTDGHEMWQSETNEFFYGKPIIIDNILYARGTNTRVIYAISPDDGHYLGYLNLGTPPLLSTSQKENDIVYKSGEFLIFTFENTVYAYHVK